MANYMDEAEWSELIKTLHKADAKLMQFKDGQPYLPKWKHPRGDLRDVQENASNITSGTSGRLEKLLRLPNRSGKTVNDAELFYEGHYDEVLFNRTKHWFKEMGFEKRTSPYSYADNWDKQYIEATYLIPDNIEQDQVVPIMWFFHGGGFCTGAGDHIPWYSKATLTYAKKHKAIIIAPDYPLGPEGNYHDIYRALKDFLRFYRDDGCFEDGEEHWTGWLASKIKKNVTIDKDNIFIEGESAGGHAAVTAMFLNAAIENAQPLPLKAVFLRYPMLKHYKRTFPTDGTKVGFMDGKYSEGEIEEYEKKLKAELLRLEQVKSLHQTGFVRTRTKGYAPAYMWAAPLLSLTGDWQWMFQRAHKAGADQAIDKTTPWNYDSLDRVEKMHDKVNHAFLPPIIMHHAPDDTNCLYADTQQFKDLLHQYYPAQYPQGSSDEKVLLVEVEELTSHPEVLNGKKENPNVVGHGYDYWQDDEPFQVKCYGRVSKYWPSPAKQ